MSDLSPATTSADAWTLLRAGPLGSGGLEVPSMELPATLPSGSVRVAIGPAGEARLLVPLEDREQVSGLEAGDALTIGVTLLSRNGGGPRRYLDIVCRARDLEPAFAELVDQIVARIGSGVSGADAVRVVLAEFRALLERTPSRNIDAARIAGLVGELLLLDRLLAISPEAWRAWRGPAGDRHDFRARDDALEVKASLRAGDLAITINGLDQLEPSRGGTLHLAHFTLEPTAGGMLSVRGLAESCLNQASEPQQIRELLALAGCADVSAPEWNREAFRLGGEQLYRVADPFPRLRSADLPATMALAAFSRVSYDLDLSFAQDRRCSADEAEALFRRFAI